MTPRTRTLATIVAGVIVAIVPACLSYLQSRDELKVKYQLTQDNAAGGYAALSASVKELQASVTQQHDFIIKLETHINIMDRYMMETRLRVGRVGGGSGAGSGSASPTPELRPPAPPERPKFENLPHDFPDAAVKFAPKR